jgi:hypothetical protein
MARAINAELKDLIDARHATVAAYQNQVVVLSETTKEPHAPAPTPPSPPR